MKAQFYTYRNLNYSNHFSTKHHGIVINYFDYAVISGGRFKVSIAGRERCLRDKKRNVHAFIASDSEPTAVDSTVIPPMDTLTEVKYNPYRGDNFVNSKNGEVVWSADNIYLIDGRCFVDAK